MPSLSTPNIAAVMRGFCDLVEGGEFESIALVMAADVIWQGLLPELRCEGRDWF